MGCCTIVVGYFVIMVAVSYVSKSLCGEDYGFEDEQECLMTGLIWPIFLAFVVGYVLSTIAYELMFHGPWAEFKFERLEESEHGVES